jgi:hypothetical protein
MAIVTRIATAQVRAALGFLSLAESDVDRFLNAAEERLRQATMATSPSDKRAWLELAEDWVKFARAART